MDDISPSFVKKVFMFMGVELLIALVAIGYFIKVGNANAVLSQAPVEIYDPQSKTDNGKVLGMETTLSPTPIIVYKIVTPTPAVTNKKEYKIAILGDSFEDTMGETGEYLQKSLKTRYENTDFLIYNYGKGATTVKDAFDNFDHEFKYGIRSYPSLTDLKPDIIIIGSYANNPPSPYDRNWHWLTYSQLIERAKKVTSKVYVLAEVAPLRAKYGDGPSGVNWDDEYAVVQSGYVVELMENVIGLSKSMHVPLIDAFTPTLEPNSKYGKEGKKQAISVSDGIHPSQDGHEFIASKIAETVNLN